MPARSIRGHVIAPNKLAGPIYILVPILRMREEKSRQLLCHPGVHGQHGVAESCEVMINGRVRVLMQREGYLPVRSDSYPWGTAVWRRRRLQDRVH